jgi:hypothetical protein
MLFEAFQQMDVRRIKELRVMNNSLGFEIGVSLCEFFRFAKSIKLPNEPKQRKPTKKDTIEQHRRLRR